MHASAHSDELDDAVIAFVRNYVFMSVALRRTHVITMCVVDARMHVRSTCRIPLYCSGSRVERVSATDGCRTSHVMSAVRESRRGVLTLHDKHRQLVATNPIR
jgi:hypothetical protein